MEWLIIEYSEGQLAEALAELTAARTAEDVTAAKQAANKIRFALTDIRERLWDEAS